MMTGAQAPEGVINVLQAPRGIREQDRPRLMGDNRSSTIEVRQGTFRVCLHGEIDLTCRPDLQQVVASYTAGQLSDVLVDLRDVTFFGIPGLVLLGDLHREVQRRQRRLILHNVPPLTRRIIQIGGLGELLVGQ
jgi:anti-anti-sigma factor